MGIIIEKHGHIAKVGLGIEETKNAFGPLELLQLNRIWEECENDCDIRVIVLYSTLRNVFCSGLNQKTALPIWAGMKDPETSAEKWFLNDNKSVGKAMLKYKNFDKPVIAAIHGYCYTCGFEMIMNCELRIASENATFRMLETQLGIMPMSGANVFLPALIGVTRSNEVLLTGEPFTAATLHEWGLLNKVVPLDSLMDEAMLLAEKIAKNGPESIQGIVRCCRDIQGKSLEEALEIEYKIGAQIFMCDNAREGISALKEKRKPHFR